MKTGNDHGLFEKKIATRTKTHCTRMTREETASMLKEKTRNDQIKGKIEEILRTASQQSDISRRTFEMIDHWLLEHEDDPDHKEVLGELFKEDFALSHKPSREAKEALQRVKIRLGMDTPVVKVPLYRRAYFQIASAAAAIIIVFGISLTLDKKENGNPARFAELTLEVIEGVQKDLTLVDGTQVWVNSNSKLSYPEGFGDDQRRVSLEGEAYFDVQSDAAHPFVVQTKHLAVKVLGTQFDIAEHHEAGYTEVTLFEGSVQVIMADGSQMLVPGEKLTLDHQTRQSRISSIESAGETDWRSDVIFADNRTLPELFGMIANYYDVRIEFAADQFSDSLTYSAGFGKQDSLTKVLGVLSDISGGFNHQERDGVIYITRTPLE